MDKVNQIQLEIDTYRRELLTSTHHVYIKRLEREATREACCCLCGLSMIRSDNIISEKEKCAVEVCK